MKFLFEITNSGLKLQDQFALHFDKITEQSHIISAITKDTDCLEHLEKNKLFNKIYSHKYFNYLKDLKNYKINYDILNSFENDLENTSIWNMISSDRAMGRVFLKDFIGYDYNNPKNLYEEYLKFFSYKLEEIIKIFDEFKPDVYVPAFCISNLDSLIIFNLCKIKNIEYANYASVRIQSYFTFSNDLMKSTPVIEKRYDQNIKNYKPNFFVDAENLYNDLMKEIEAPKYFDRHSSRVQKKDLSSIIKTQKYFFSMIKLLFVGKKRTFFDTLKKIFNLKFLYYTLVEFFYHTLQKISMTKNKFKHIDKNENYIYYTLHSAPEYSVNMQGNYWSDQIYNLEVIAKSIPGTWKLYTKEHPATLSDRTRPNNFFDKILKIPNVKILNTYEDMHEIISNARLVIVVVGTAGIEAILRGKPSIAFTNNTWDMLQLSSIVERVENLPSLIKTTIKENANLTKDERKKRLVCYFDSIINEGFWLSHPGAATWLEETNNETEYTSGKELAKGLDKYLNSLKGIYEKK
jgi:hypothetical protein